MRSNEWSKKVGRVPVQVLGRGSVPLGDPVVDVIVLGEGETLEVTHDDEREVARLVALGAVWPESVCHLLRFEE